MTRLGYSPHDLPSIRERVRAHAQARGRVFRRGELAALQVDDAVVKTMIRRGWWIRLHHGVYADSVDLVPDVTPDGEVVSVPRAYIAASIAALDNPAFAFGASAALLHELAMQPRLADHVELVRPLGTDQRALRRRISSRTALSGTVVHSHALPAQDVDVVDGVPTVCRDLAAVSTAAVSRPDWAVATLDAAAWQRPEAIGRMSELTDSWPRLRGIGTVRRVLPHVRAGAQTPLETFSRLRLIRCGLDEPALQRAHYDGKGLIGYADMTWPDWRVIGEADGLAKYQVRDDLLREKEREDRLRAVGFAVVRWTWREIMDEPEEVARRIRQARQHTSRSVA